MDEGRTCRDGADLGWSCEVDLPGVRGRISLVSRRPRRAHESRVKRGKLTWAVKAGMRVGKLDILTYQTRLSHMEM